MDRQTALLEWVNSFTLSEDVESLSELTDGYILWDILRDVDPTFFTSSLPQTRGSTTKWIPRYENLKYLHKTLASYISEECGQVLYAPHAGDGLQAIAKDASLQEFLKLFQLILQATICSPRQQEYILKMLSLTAATQASLKKVIEDTEEPEEAGGQQDGAGTDPSSFVLDPELVLEERYGKILAENELLLQERKDYQGQIREMDDRLVRLQESYNLVKQDLTEAQDQLKMKASVRNGTENRSVKELQLHIQQQENDFADQESRMAKQDRKLEAALKKVANLEASTSSLSQKARDAQDELDEIKREKDACARKANTADKFKQQLQASKKENNSLRSRLEDYQKEDADFENLRHENVGLQTQIEEFEKLVPRIEEDNAESFRIRGQLQLDIEALHKDLSSVRKQHKQALATITELKQRVRSSSVSSVGSHDNVDLEAEFTGLANKQAAEREVISTNETQVKHLTNTIVEQNSTIESLQRQIDEANDHDTGKKGSEPDMDKNTSDELKDLRNQVKRLQKELHARSLDQNAPLPDHPKLTPEIRDLVAEIIGGSKTVDDNAAAQEWCRNAVAEGRARIIEAEKTVEQQKSTIASLEERLKNAESTAAAGAKKEQEEKLPLPDSPELHSLREQVSFLKRELRLMSSAFHSLNERHQYDGMTVQRKSEAPSSWLGKQRRIVEGNLRGGGAVGGMR